MTDTDTTGPRAVLAVDDLHVRYGGSHILQGVSFQVPSTGVTALLGRNGVGKTTTLKAILGLAPRTVGSPCRGPRSKDGPRPGSCATASATCLRTARSSAG